MRGDKGDRCCFAAVGAAVNTEVATQLRTVAFKCRRNLFAERFAEPALQKGCSPEEGWEGRCVNVLSAINGRSYPTAWDRLDGISHWPVCDRRSEMEISLSPSLKQGWFLCFV